MTNAARARWIGTIAAGIAGAVALAPPDYLSQIILGTIIAGTVFLLVTVLYRVPIIQRSSPKARSIAAYATAVGVFAATFIVVSYVM